MSYPIRGEVSGNLHVRFFSLYTEKCVFSQKADYKKKKRAADELLFLYIRNNSNCAGAKYY